MRETLTRLGEWFKKQRELRGEDWQQQADHIGLGQTAICHYSYGRRQLSKKIALKIAENYGLNEEEKKEFFIACLSDEEIEIAESISHDMAPEEIAVKMKFNV